jgi:hypothetical protein
MSDLLQPYLYDLIYDYEEFMEIINETQKKSLSQKISKRLYELLRLISEIGLTEELEELIFAYLKLEKAVDHSSSNS